MDLGKYELVVVSYKHRGKVQHKARVMNKETGIMVAEDMPGFLLLAKDAYAERTVANYMNTYNGHAPQSFIENVYDVVKKFRKWKSIHPDQIKLASAPEKEEGDNGKDNN